MPKDRDTTRGQRTVFGARDEIPGPGSEERRPDASKERLAPASPTPTRAKGDELFPEGSDRTPTKTRG